MLESSYSKKFRKLISSLRSFGIGFSRFALKGSLPGLVVEARTKAQIHKSDTAPYPEIKSYVSNIHADALIA